MKFVTQIVITILVIVFLLFVAYGWVLYQQKVKDSTVDSNHPPQSTPLSASIVTNNADATNSLNTSDASLSPMPVPANPN